MTKEGGAGTQCDAESRSELAPRLFSNRSGPPEPSITYPRQMLRQLPAAWPFRDLAEQLGRSVDLRGALGDEGFGATQPLGGDLKGTILVMMERHARTK